MGWPNDLFCSWQRTELSKWNALRTSSHSKIPYIILYYIMVYYIILYYVILYYIILCYIILYYIYSIWQIYNIYPLQRKNIAIEYGPWKYDDLLIQNADFPVRYVSLPKGSHILRGSRVAKYSSESLPLAQSHSGQHVGLIKHCSGSSSLVKWFSKTNTHVSSGNLT